MSQSFKKELLKEASERTSRSMSKTASSEVTFTKLLTAEAEYRIRNIKEASLQKEAMAAHATKELKNSVSNTIWTIPDKTNRIKQIEQELMSGFAPYARHLIAKLPGLRRQRGDIPHLKGFFAGEKGVSLSDEGDNSTLRMEFQFHRQVMPISGQSADYAKQNVDMLEEVVPGFADFVEAVNEHKIPLVPGYDTNKPGRPDQLQVKNFIKSEAQKQESLQTPTGNIPMSSFWQDHMARINMNRESAEPKITYQRPNDRLFEPKEAFSITYPSYLLRAIQTRIMQGFRLDEDRLHRAISANIKRVIAQSNASRRSRNRQNALYYYILTHWVKQQKDKIIAEYNKAVGPPNETENKMRVQRLKNSQWSPEDIDVHMASWGESPTSGQSMRGLRTNVPIENTRQSKNLYCLDMNNTELQYLLYSLTVHDENEIQKEKLPKNLREIPENGFIIPDFSLTYTSNGFDSDPSQAIPGMIGPQMLVIPPLVRVPSHLREQYPQGVAYNTDHGNLARSILAGSGASDNVVAFLSDPRVGEFALNALKHLQEPSIAEPGRRRRRGGRALGKNVQSLFEESKGAKSAGAYEAWAKYIGTVNKANRTSAETLQQNVLFNPQTGQPRSREELEQFLKFSWASEVNRGRVSDWARKILTARRQQLGQLAVGQQLIPFLESVAQHPDNFDEATAKQLTEALRHEANIKVIDPPKRDRRGREKPTREYEDLIKRVLTRGARQAQSAEHVEVTDEEYELLHKYGYAVAKMMDFLHALMVRSCEEKLIRKLSPAAAQKKLEEYKQMMEEQGIPVDEADISVEKPINLEIHHFSYGRTYAPTTGKNQKGSIVFGVKYAFNAPEFNPDDAVFKNIYERARESSRSRGKGQGLYAPQEGQDPGMGRRTSLPQGAQEREEVFQPQGKQGVIRIVEDMTFWFGMKSSEKDWAKTQRGTRRDVGFSMQINETYSYQDALAALRSNYPAIENDLDIVYSPISVNVSDMKRAADKAVAAMKRELQSHGIDVDIAITDPFNRVRLDHTMEEIGAAAAVEQMESETDDGADHRQPSTGYTHQYDAGETQPEQTDTGQGTVPVDTIPMTEPLDEPAPEMDDDVLPEPQQPEQQMPPAPQPPAQPPHQPPDEEEPRQMPKPMEYVGKPKKKRPLIRNGPDPQTAKLRRSSSDDVLVKLADKLDRQGQSEVANKLDALLAILREE